jgi:hypothetical protein
MSILQELIVAGQYEQVEERLLQCPEEAGTIGLYNLFSQKSRCYPLHYICRRQNVPQSTLRALLDATPVEALVFRESATWSTPLHVACWYQLPASTLALLVHRQPRALRLMDRDGSLPVHLTASLHPEASKLVPIFLVFFPETAKWKNRKEQTPLKLLQAHQTLAVLVQEIILRQALDGKADHQPLSPTKGMARTSLLPSKSIVSLNFFSRKRFRGSSVGAQVACHIK